VHKEGNLSEVIDTDTGESIGLLIRYGEKSEYSEELGDIILQRVIGGEKVTNILKDDGFPSYATFCKWKRDNDDFRFKIKEAQEDAGMVFFEKARDTVEKSTNDTVKTDKLKSDFYMRAAASFDPETFGNKTKVSGEVAVSQIYAIDTGISRNVTDTLDGAEEINQLGEHHGIDNTSNADVDTTADSSFGGEPAETIDD
jgi:hypothetical protein